MSLPSNGYVLVGACSTEEDSEPAGADVLQELQAIREEQRELRLMQLRHKQDINSLLAQGRKAHEDMERLFGSVVMLSGRVDQVVASWANSWQQEAWARSVAHGAAAAAAMPITPPTFGLAAMPIAPPTVGLLPDGRPNQRGAAPLELLTPLELAPRHCQRLVRYIADLSTYAQGTDHRDLPMLPVEGRAYVCSRMGWTPSIDVPATILARFQVESPQQFLRRLGLQDYRIFLQSHLETLARREPQSAEGRAAALAKFCWP